MVLSSPEPSEPSFYRRPVPQHCLRAVLMASFYENHGPELADLVASADLLPDSDGFWVQPSAAFADLSPAWLERKLFAAGVSSGLAVEWVHVLCSAQDREGASAPVLEMLALGN